MPSSFNARLIILLSIAMCIHWLCVTVTAIPLAFKDDEVKFNECVMCMDTFKNARSYSPITKCITDRCFNVTQTVAQLALDRNFANFTASELCDELHYCKENRPWPAKIVTMMLDAEDENI